MNDNYYHGNNQNYDRQPQNNQMQGSNNVKFSVRAGIPYTNKNSEIKYDNFTIGKIFFDERTSKWSASLDAVTLMGICQKVLNSDARAKINCFLNEPDNRSDEHR